MEPSSFREIGKETLYSGYKHMEHHIIPVTAFEQNSTLLWCKRTRRGAVVDPGGDIPRIMDAARAAGVTVDKILLTHGHIDHAGGAQALSEQWDIPIEGPHPDDEFLLTQLPDQASLFGFPPCSACRPDRWLSHGDVIHFGQITLDVLHTPGHTPGHVAFFHPGSRLACVGDVLFAGSVGRTDFPRGDYDQLLRSINNTLLTLGDDVRFIPGHGPTSTFGYERRHNPFLIA
jgi:hydroxyacylglutathione hydrolase